MELGTIVPWHAPARVDPVQPRPTGVEMPSTIWSFHWSKTVIFQLPAGMPLKAKFPVLSHLVKANSAPSGSPRLT